NVELSSTQVTTQYSQSAAIVPTSPTDAAAESGTGSATVTWTTPESDGGSPITAYVITPSVDGVAEPPKTYDSTAVSQVVTGLQKGHSYTFEVAAGNARGLGPNSMMSNAISPK